MNKHVIIPSLVAFYSLFSPHVALAQTAAPTTTPSPTPTPIPNPDLALLPTGFADNMTILITSLLSVAIAFVALLVFFYLIWGGIDWITSGGDKGKTEQARSKILAAVIGLIIVAASYAIVQLLVRFLGYPSLTAVFEGIVPLSGGGGVSLVSPTPTTSSTPTL